MVRFLPRKCTLTCEFGVISHAFPLAFLLWFAPLHLNNGAVGLLAIPAGYRFQIRLRATVMRPFDSSMSLRIAVRGASMSYSFTPRVRGSKPRFRR